MQRSMLTHKLATFFAFVVLVGISTPISAKGQMSKAQAVALCKQQRVDDIQSCVSKVIEADGFGCTPSQVEKSAPLDMMFRCLDREREDVVKAAASRKAFAEKADASRKALAQKAAHVAKLHQEAQYACSDKKQCDKAFSLAQIFISTAADMKIQVATDVVVETYTPTRPGLVGMKAIRLPQKGDSASISLTVSCDDGIDQQDRCLDKARDAYTNFAPFLRKSM